MIYPTISDLTKNGDFNRYEIALATAKCARMITSEYVEQREEAERSMTGNKETDKPLHALIDREVIDEKAVKLAIGRIHNGEYTIVHKEPVEEEEPVEVEPIDREAELARIAETLRGEDDEDED
ncbi:MAG: DNA-directed RNA polymerase subunit omega [Clostridia bacterium]|nr:DNA-directed RNA polymerase subunit omega [Clostridia bacterium]